MSQNLGRVIAISLLLLGLLFVIACGFLVASGLAFIPWFVTTGVSTADEPPLTPLPVATVAGAPAASPAGAPPATSPTARIAVQAPDKSVKLVGLDGQGALLTTAGMSFELGRPDNVIADTIYAFSPYMPAGVYAIDARGAHRLDFIPTGISGFAVNAHGTPMLAWGTGTFGPTSYSEIVVSAPDGSNRQSRIKETFVGEPRVLRPLQFSANGSALYYGKEPVGLGGYILFGGLSNLWSLDLHGGGTSDRLNGTLAGASACIDGVADPLVSTHCDFKHIQILDLVNGNQPARFIQPPAGLAFGQIGSAAFDPAGTRVAYALARGDAANEQGWLLVSEGLSGASRVIGQSQPQTYFSVLGWLDAESVLVQSLSTAAPTQTGAVWLARADGRGMTKLADGTFLALLPSTPR